MKLKFMVDSRVDDQSSLHECDVQNTVFSQKDGTASTYHIAPNFCDLCNNVVGSATI